MRLQVHAWEDSICIVQLPVRIHETFVAPRVILEIQLTITVVDFARSYLPRDRARQRKYVEVVRERCTRKHCWNVLVAWRRSVCRRLIPWGCFPLHCQRGQESDLSSQPSTCPQIMFIMFKYFVCRCEVVQMHAGRILLKLVVRMFSYIKGYPERQAQERQ